MQHFLFADFKLVLLLLPILTFSSRARRLFEFVFDCSCRSYALEAPDELGTVPPTRQPAERSVASCVRPSFGYSFFEKQPSKNTVLDLTWSFATADTASAIHEKHAGRRSERSDAVRPSGAAIFETGRGDRQGGPHDKRGQQVVDAGPLHCLKHAKCQKRCPQSKKSLFKAKKVKLSAFVEGFPVGAVVCAL